MFYTIYSELCHSIGKSPSWVAERLGINKSSVTYWRNNPDSRPSMENMHKIADYFNVSIDYLSGKKKEPEIDDIRYAIFRELKTEDETFIEDVLSYIRFKKYKNKS